jgi:hypothetical protein
LAKLAFNASFKFIDFWNDRISKRLSLGGSDNSREVFTSVEFFTVQFLHRRNRSSPNHLFTSIRSATNTNIPAEDSFLPKIIDTLAPLRTADLGANAEAGVD